MAEEHTAANIRKEFWIPKLLDRSNFQNWQKNGGTSLLDRARERVETILQTHAPQPLEPTLTQYLMELAQRGPTE